MVFVRKAISKTFLVVICVAAFLYGYMKGYISGFQDGSKYDGREGKGLPRTEGNPQVTEE